MPYAGDHRYQTNNHRLETYVFADEASRDAGTGYTITADDIARVGYQQDNETYYRLVGVNPLSWIPIGGGGSQAPADASFITHNAESGLTNERVLGTQIVMQGVIASRPSRAVMDLLSLSGGSLYYATDEDRLYRDSGSVSSTWDLWTFDYGVITGVPSSVIVFTLDNGADPIAVGTQADFWAPYDATIQGVTLLADQSGSIVIDIWKDTYGNYPPTDADSITASAVPTISSALKYQDLTLTGWTTSITDGNCLRVNVDSCSLITRCTLILKVLKT